LEGIQGNIITYFFFHILGNIIHIFTKNLNNLLCLQISTPQCRHSFEESNGIIKSPNYPLVYPNATDCRWSINVEPSLKVRLLFAFFETQEGADFLYVSGF
jgi:hypothetical protein